MKKIVIKGEKTIIAPIPVIVKHGLLTTNGGENSAIEYIYFAEATGLYYYANKLCEVKQDGHTYRSDAPINFLSGQSVGTPNENQTIQLFGAETEKIGYFVDIE